MWFFRFAGGFFGILGITLAVMGWKCSLLPYDEEGRYFDPIEGAVWSSDAVLVWTFGSALLLITSVGCFLIGSIRSANQANS